MDFRFSQEEEAFRQEVRGFLEKELPPNWVGPTTSWEQDAIDELWEFSQVMARKLGEKGWLSITWPKEYGGLAGSYVQQAIFSEEIGYHRAVGIDPAGVRFLAPALIAFGSEEQKRRHLKPIAAGEVTWCECFSEPEAGSDLASVQTRALPDGNGFIISGQKVWSSAAHRSDWCFLLARTNDKVPKHKGLSFFLVDMKTPGITVRPLLNIAGLYSFAEVFFDEVKVPRENLVGEENKGWYVTMSVLSFERAFIDHVGIARRMLDDLSKYAKELYGNNKVPDIIRQRLAELKVEAEVARLFAYRVVLMQQRGVSTGTESAMLRMFLTELRQRIANTGMELLGVYGQLGEGSKWIPLAGMTERHYLISFALTIAAGTSEIQRNIIATRGLGLPSG